MKGILGRKIGMTQLFTESGKSIPITVIEIPKNIVTNVFTKEKDGYVALQIATGDKRDKVTSKPMLGHFKKAKTNGKYFVKEIKGMEGYNLGDEIKPTIFNPGQFVDVTGISKGKGFQGNIKRHNQKIGPKSHGGGGGSQPVRQTGSLGDMVSNRVFKGMTMPGHMGHTQVTIQNLEIVSINVMDNAILIKGSIPGPKKSYVIIKDAIKLFNNKEALKIFNLKEVELKKELMTKAKELNVEVNENMSLIEIQELINEALELIKQKELEQNKIKEEAKIADANATQAIKNAEDLNNEKALAEQKSKQLHEEALKAKQEAEEIEKKAQELHEKEEVIDAAAQKIHDEAKKIEAEKQAALDKAKNLEKEAQELDSQTNKLNEKVSEAKEEAAEKQKEAQNLKSNLDNDSKKGDA